MKLLFIDTETGGLEPGKHSLLSVALAAWEDGKIVDETEIHLVHEVYNVTQKALEINKIDLRVPREGVPTFTAMMTIIAFIQQNFGKDRPTIVGQNVQFDLGFLYELFSGKQHLERHISHRVLDTASIIRFTELAGLTHIGGSGLSDAIDYFRIDLPAVDRHTALGDVRATAEVFNKLLEIGRSGGASLA